MENVQLYYLDFFHQKGFHIANIVSPSSPKESVKVVPEKNTFVEASETRGTTALGLLSDRYQLIYRYCTKVVEYTPTGLTVSRGVASSPHFYLCPAGQN
jgi:hypothetical protein